MAGQISQIDLEIQQPDTDPSRFVQLRFPSDEVPAGNIYFYDSKNANETVLVLSATIDVTSTIPTDTFVADGYSYYTYAVDADILQGNPQNFGIVYADSSGTVQSTVIFGENNNPGDVTFDDGPLNGQTVDQIIEDGSVEGGGFQPGDGPFVISPDGDVTTTPDPNPGAPCFAEGTMILGARGEVPVEGLRAGDLVISMRGTTWLEPVVWVGRTRVDLTRQRDRRAAAPILIRAGALGPGVPYRDLRVSPEHALRIDGYLVPARLLVNGAGIVQELWRQAVTYYHLELATHGLLVSDGAVSESYFDDGNRALFDNAAIVALVVDFEANRGNGRYAEAACAPVLTGGAALDAIRIRIAGHAGPWTRPVPSNEWRVLHGGLSGCPSGGRYRSFRRAQG